MSDDIGFSPDTMLRRLIGDGMHPEEAAAAVVDRTYGDEVLGLMTRIGAEWLTKMAVERARRFEGQASSRAMKGALSAKGAEPGSARMEAAARRLRQTVYRLPDGTRVLWDDMTPDMIRAKIELFSKMIGSLSDHVAILSAALELCQERKAARLRDIEGWPALVRKIVERDVPGEEGDPGEAA